MFATKNHTDLGLGDTEALGDGALGFPRVRSVPNLAGLRLGKPRIGREVTVYRGAASLARAIGDVVFVCPEEQMHGVAARRVIAAVKDVQPVRNWSNEQFIGQAMGHAEGAVFASVSAIPEVIAAPFPFPAPTRCLVRASLDLTPGPLNSPHDDIVGPIALECN